MPLEPNYDAADAFLRTLDPTAEAFTFQTFDDNQGPGHQRDPTLAVVLNGSLPQCWDRLCEKSAKGAGVFHTVNLTDLRGRTKANILAVRYHFVDFDGVPIANLNRFPLSLHMFVQTSENKFHVYWRVEGATLAGFKTTQTRLNALLDSDPSVTDLSRVLRLPGFPHQKDPAHPFMVQMATPKTHAPFTDSEFDAALTGAETNHVGLTLPTLDGHAVPKYLMRVKDAPGLLNIGGDERPSDPHAIAERCAQVRRLRDAHGRLPEPEWYSILGVLVHCGDRGREVAHEWSSGDPCYRFEDTDRKLDHYLADASGPTTCKRLNTLVPGVCTSCEHKDRITSPIQLGRDRLIGSADKSEVAESEIDRRLRELAALSLLDYERERENAAKNLKCRVGVLDTLVEAERAKNAPSVEVPVGQGRPIKFPEIEPWPESVDGDSLLDEAATAIRSYVILTNVQCHATALWALYTHVFDVFDVSPKLIVKSVKPRSGKSRLVEVMGRIVARPLYASGIKAAALLRLIESHSPTLLLDEMDAALKGNQEQAEALRGLQNSGFNRAGAFYVMNVPTADGGWSPAAFSTWAPQMLAGIGNQPDTIRDRSIEIELQRKLQIEKVRPLRQRDGADLHVVVRKFVRWAADNMGLLRSAYPVTPAGLHDRAADAWSPLFAIADLAGGEWPDRARTAALALSGDGVVEDDDIGTMLLTDIRKVFMSADASRLGVIETRDEGFAIPSARLVSALVEMAERPWSEFGRSRRSISHVTLARLLKKHHINPSTIRIGDTNTPKGYKLKVLNEVFLRYLPPYNDN